MIRDERDGQSIADSLDSNFGYFDVNNLALNNVIAAKLYSEVREIICGQVRLPGVTCFTLNSVNASNNI